MNCKLSARWARTMFHPCTPEYIREVCGGRCCRSSAGGISVAVSGAEAACLRGMGARVCRGLVLPDERGLCPFQLDDGLCRIHGEEQPDGCVLSPFTLHATAPTIIIRHRYLHLPCHRVGPRLLPAYRAFPGSLQLLLGCEQAAEVTRLLDEGGEEDLAVVVPDPVVRLLRSNHAARSMGHQSMAKRDPGKGSLRPDSQEDGVAAPPPHPTAAPAEVNPWLWLALE